MALHQPPIIAQHLAVAQQLRGRDHGLHAGRQRRQRGRQHAGHVEQRIAVDDHVAGSRALQLHRRPGREDLVGVGMDGQLGRAGGAAGMEVGGHVVGADHAAADQPVRGLGGARAVEVEREAGQRRALRRRLVMRRDAQQRAQRRHPLAQAQGLRPGFAFGVRAVGDQHLGASGGQQRGQLVLGQQRIERLHDAGRLAAPQRQVVFEAARQQHADRVRRAEPQAVQQVGGLVDAGQQLVVAPADGRLVGIGAAQEGQRGAVAEGGGRVAEDLVGALHRQRLGQRPGRQSAHVVDGTHREWRGEGRGGGGGYGGLRHDAVLAAHARPSAM